MTTASTPHVTSEEGPRGVNEILTVSRLQSSEETPVVAGPEPQL